MLKAKFIINDKKEIEYLSEIYQNVSGQLTFHNNKILHINWKVNPFIDLLDHPKILDDIKILEYKGWIEASLKGPFSAKEIANEVIKSNCDKESVWTNFINQIVENDLKRDHDIGLVFTPPPIILDSLEELFLSFKSTKYVTHFIPSKEGYLIANENSKYLIYIGLNDYCFTTSIPFDEVGYFCSKFMINVDYINQTFALWKEHNYEGPIENYYI